MGDQQARYETLDGMRGIAALSVMIYHFTLHDERPLFQHATMAVDLFFMLSGFVIMHSYGARVLAGMSAADYLKKRVIRLYPMFILSLLAGTMIFLGSGLYPHGLTSQHEIIAASALNAAFLPYLNFAQSATETSGSVFPANVSLWSLFFEMFASICFLALCRFRLKYLALFSLASFIALSLWAATHLYITGTLVFEINTGWDLAHFIGGFPRVLFGFSLGMVLYEITPKIAGNKYLLMFAKLPYPSFWLFAVMLATFSVHYEFKGLYNYVVIVSVLPLLLVLGAIGKERNKFELKTNIFLGWISYPLYCLHFPVLVAAEYFGGGHFDSTPINIAMLSVMTIVLSVVVTLLYDQPLRAWLSRKGR